MRGMNRFYHQRFFNDVRFLIVATIALFVVGFWEIPEAFLLVPAVALIGGSAAHTLAAATLAGDHIPSPTKPGESLDARSMKLIGQQLALPAQVKSSIFNHLT